MMNKPEKTMSQHITLEDRKKLRITGVKDIDSFSENKIVINTVLGELVVKGQELHIIMLENETGDLSMTGKIDSVVYNSFAANANIFRRLFR